MFKKTEILYSKKNDTAKKHIPKIEFGFKCKYIKRKERRKKNPLNVQKFLKKIPVQLIRNVCVLSLYDCKNPDPDIFQILCLSGSGFRYNLIPYHCCSLRIVQLLSTTPLYTEV